MTDADRPLAIQDRSLATVVVVATAAALAAPLFYSQAALFSSFADDFYYYAKIAKEIAAGHGSTFGGMSATNGYHPLWQVMLVPLFALSSRLGIEGVALCRVAVASLAAGACFAMWRYVRAFMPAGPWRGAFFLFVAGYYLGLARTGMEVVVSTPLFLAFVASAVKPQKRYWLIGLLASLVVLARIDAAVILIIFFAAHLYFVRPTWGQLIQIAVAGALPTGAYLAINYAEFGVLAPVSGMAKSVLSVGWINLATLTSLFNGSYLATNVLALAVYIGVLALTPGCFAELSREQKAATFTAIVAPPGFFLQNALRSDWPLWTWYYFAILFCVLLSIFAIARITSDERGGRWKRHWGHVARASMAVFFAVMACHISLPRETELHRAGRRIQAFAEDHPGVYAIGDQAGLVGYLLNRPLVQLEGLVMDLEFLQRFREAKDLKEILDAYGVDYYVGIDLQETIDGHFVVIEPRQSRGVSLQLTTELAWPAVYRADRVQKIGFREPHTYTQVILERPANDPKPANRVLPLRASF